MNTEMPHSPDSERAVIGSILLDNTLLNSAGRELPPDWFYVPSYRTIFRAMLLHSWA
jgi:replicative DNA helicase